MILPFQMAGGGVQLSVEIEVMYRMGDLETIKDALSYDASTGEFIWIFNRRRGLSGVRAGCVGTGGYCQIRYRGKEYKAHRLAWFFIYGELPSIGIDHIDRDKTNNRISNLRLATTAENGQNISAIYSSNKSGYTGVHWHKTYKKWQAKIGVASERIHLGYYNSAEEAADAYLDAKKKYHTFWVEAPTTNLL
jgi:hypothetical protein